MPRSEATLHTVILWLSREINRFISCFQYSPGIHRRETIHGERANLREGSFFRHPKLCESRRVSNSKRRKTRRNYSYISRWRDVLGMELWANNIRTHRSTCWCRAILSLFEQRETNRNNARGREIANCIHQWSGDRNEIKQQPIGELYTVIPFAPMSAFVCFRGSWLYALALTYYAQARWCGALFSSYSGIACYAWMFAGMMKLVRSLFIMFITCYIMANI